MGEESIDSEMPREAASLMAGGAQSDLALQALEQPYRTTVESMTDAMHVVDRQLKIVLCNSALDVWCARLGVCGACIGQTLPEIFPFLPNGVLDEYRRVFETGRVLETEETTEVAGRRIVTETRKVPVFDRGAVTRVITLMRDITERKRTEEALRDSEAKYKALVETTNTGYVILDDHGRVIDANQEYVRLAGHRRLEEILGRSVLEWTAPHELARNAEEVRKCVECGSVRNLEVDYVDGEGRIKPVEVNATVLGVPPHVRILTLCRDITERKRIEVSLRKREAVAKALLNASTEPIMLLNTDGTVVAANEAMTRRLGIAAEDFVGAHAFHFLDSELAEQRHARVQEVVRTGKPLRFDDQRRGRVLDNHVYPVFGEAGQVTGVAVFAQDVTDRRRAEAALREGERQNAILNTIPDIAWLKDLQGRFLAVNTAWREFTGNREPIEVLGRTVFEIFPPDLAASLDQEDLEVVRSGKPMRRESVMRGREGQPKWYDTIKRPVLDAQGGVVATVGIARDITDRKTVEEELERLTARLRGLAAQLVCAEEQERQRVAAILHEDLQQMLAGAKYTLGALKKAVGKEDRQRTVADLDRALDEAIQTTRSLSLDLRLPVLYESGLEAALRWLADDMRKKHELDVQLEVDAAAESMADELRIFIFHAVRELLFNVSKHACVKAARIRVGVDDEDIQVEVSDGGVGFDASASKPVSLGLFNIRERAVHFGGRMDVLSKIGQGTLVTITLPWLRQAQKGNP